MVLVSPKAVWKADSTEFLKIIDSGVFLREKRKVSFYAPSFAGYRNQHFSCSHDLFPTFSVTGDACALNCKHCGKEVLKTMSSTKTPSELFEAARMAKQRGGVGCLVSGGCLSNGSVPLKNFIPTLARIKKEIGLTVMVHTGIIDLTTAEALMKAAIDTALIDIIGSDETIRQIFGANFSTKDYELSLEAMSQAGLKFVPHVIVGLQNGKLGGELQALKMIAKFNPSALVVIAFMPIRGTVMEFAPATDPVDVARVIAVARLMLKETRIALGCMRPKGRKRATTDVLALKAGVDAIAFPSDEAIVFAEEHGYDIAYSSYCCAHLHEE